MIWTHAAAALLAATLAFGSGWKVRDWKAGADRTADIEQRNRDALRRAEHVDQAAVGYEVKREAGQQRQRVIIQEVERVIEKPIYRNVCLDDDGLRAVAAALGASAPTSRASSPMP